MGASVSYKLKNSIQGALAGGGDPATSPLYVFGPFLALIVGAGVADVTFGASIWLAVFMVITVSAMYRYVMRWVTDGSGGSGLSEEEFGSWAVKVNAAVTVIEYTLTFLVSMAALVTFIADRFPILNGSIGFISTRTLVAVLLSFLVVLVVNRGPKASSQFFGPATGLILGFLWLMVFSVIWQKGLKLPHIDLRAFDSGHIHFRGWWREMPSENWSVLRKLGKYLKLLSLAYKTSQDKPSSKSFFIFPEFSGFFKL